MADETTISPETVFRKLNSTIQRCDVTPAPPNGLTTPSRERIREAVREAHDPRRLVDEPRFLS